MLNYFKAFGYQYVYICSFLCLIMRIEGIVISINPTVLIDEYGSKRYVNLNREVDVPSYIVGSIENNNVFIDKIIENREAYRNFFNKITKNIDVNQTLFYEDEVIKKFKPDILQFARLFTASALLKRTINVHFHNDADGIVSAYAISSILRGKYFQHNGAIYSIQDALNDIQSLRYGFMPMVINLDFSSNYESEDGIDLLNSSGIDIIIVDHHPNNMKKEFILNPWDVCNDGSKYTAGLLSSLISYAAGGKYDLYPVSLAGDKSNLMDLNEQDKERALVLDFLATYKVFGNNLHFYIDVLKNKTLYEEIKEKAIEKLNAIRKIVNKFIKKETINGINIYTINLDKVSTYSEFPGRGKITSIVYDMIKDENAIVLGVSKYMIIFRLTDKAVQYVKANELINMLKEQIPTIKNGGGHDKAAAIIFNTEDYIPAALELIRAKIQRGFST